MTILIIGYIICVILSSIWRTRPQEYYVPEEWKKQEE